MADLLRNTMTNVERYGNRSLLFIYNGLKSNKPSHHRMEGLFLTDAKTYFPRPFLIHPHSATPVLLNQTEGSKCVHGELYAVTDEELKLIDYFMGVPVVNRRMIALIEDNKKKTYRAWVHYYNRDINYKLEDLIDTY